MAKRGEKRPWKLQFEWDNGVKGSQTFSSEDARDDMAAQIRENAAMRSMEVDIRLSGPVG